jgi:hypothetical protein
MEPLHSHNPFPQPTRFQGVSLPPSRLDIREVTTVLFLVEHGALEKTLSNLLSAAALHRAITVKRGAAPTFKIMGENQLWNSLQGMGENSFTQGVTAGEHALFVTSASLYRRQMAQLAGVFAMAGATFDGFPHLVDDDVKLGCRNDPHTPIRDFVSTVTRDVRDPHVRELLRLAATSEVEEGNAPIVTELRAALSTLQTTSLPWNPKGPVARPEVMPSLQQMIAEWSDGAVVPSLCHSFVERHDEAEGIARSIWEGAEEVAPGVFQLIEFPYEETDEVVRVRLREIYAKDARARYVVERGVDRPTTSLSYGEALEFERRLGAGESAKEILDEVEALFAKRHDRSCSVDLAMAELRDRDPKDTLELILRKAQYIPDPEGVRYSLLKYPEEDCVKTLQEHEIPIITHNTLWLVDLKSGTSRPVTISFQGQYLERFFAMVGSDS